MEEGFREKLKPLFGELQEAENEQAAISRLREEMFTAPMYRGSGMGNAAATGKLIGVGGAKLVLVAGQKPSHAENG